MSKIQANGMFVIYWQRQFWNDERQHENDSISIDVDTFFKSYLVQSLFSPIKRVFKFERQTKQSFVLSIFL